MGVLLRHGTSIVDRHKYCQLSLTNDRPSLSHDGRDAARRAGSPATAIKTCLQIIIVYLFHFH